MLGTISCASRQSECATPGSMKAFCMSTTTSAVLRRIEIVVDVLAAAPRDDAIDDRLRNGDLVHQSSSSFGCDLSDHRAGSGRT